MTADPLDYPRMVQQALRGVVHRSLKSVAARGLPGEHHFYLAFGTTAPGVQISAELQRQYPEQMTIVLQHDYRDLEVDEDHFAVTLRFGGVPQRLYVPFGALLSFYDPAAQFALRFDPDVENGDGEVKKDKESDDGGGRAAVRAVLAAADRLAAEKEAARVESADDEGAEAAGADDDSKPLPGGAALRFETPVSDAKPARASQDTSAEAEDGGAEDGGSQGSGADSDSASSDSADSTAKDSPDEAKPVSDNVVSIDAFRRK